MRYLSFILPTCILSVCIYAGFKRVKLYDEFVKGAKNGIDTVLSILPYLIVVFIMTELFTVSGLSDKLIKLLSPVFKFLGIPREITPLVILKPFSGSGSLARLTEIFTENGVDSYVSRWACAVYGSSETVFYVSAVYFSKSKEKRLTRPILICLASTLFSTVIACFLCKFL